MGQIDLSGRRGTQPDAVASGKGRNDPERPICPTCGPVLLPRDVVARLTRCPTSRGDALLVTKQNNMVRMPHINPEGL